MVSRLARSALGASRGLRPAMPNNMARSTLPAATAARASYSSSNVPAQDPQKKAQSLIDALPGNNLVSKTAILSTASALGIYALSNEYYVMNEETVIAFCLLSVWTGVFKLGGPAYKDWADSQNERIKGILNTARAEHTDAVRTRIGSVKEMGGVVDVTRTLFEVSKESAELEAKAFELEQKTAIAAEAKAVLDSWVRYENQVKQRQQKELAESIISKVTKELEAPKNLQQILLQSVADVEKVLAAKSK